MKELKKNRACLREAKNLKRHRNASQQNPLVPEDDFRPPVFSVPRPGLCRQMAVWSCVSFVFLILSLILTDLWARCGFSLPYFFYYLTEAAWPRYVIGLIPPLLVLLGAWAAQNRPDSVRIPAVLCTVFLALQILAMLMYQIRTEFGVPGWFYRNINGCDFLSRFVAVILEPSLLTHTRSAVSFAGSFCGLVSSALAAAALLSFRKPAR